MIKRNILKLLIFFLTTSVGVVKAYGYSEAVQTLNTTVQPTVAITKSTTSIENGDVNPEDGVHSGLSSVFDIQTNGDDTGYDFIIQSSILDSSDAKVSAYGNAGCILFGNMTTKPTQAAIENAKVGGRNNMNVIAYPVNAVITEPMNINYVENYGIYGDCYVVKVNNAKEGSVTHSVGTSPVAGTYDIGQDQMGSYQAVVTFTAVSK